MCMAMEASTARIISSDSGCRRRPGTERAKSTRPFTPGLAADDAGDDPAGRVGCSVSGLCSSRTASPREVEPSASRFHCGVVRLLAIFGRVAHPHLHCEPVQGPLETLAALLFGEVAIGRTQLCELVGKLRELCGEPHLQCFA